METNKQGQAVQPQPVAQVMGVSAVVVVQAATTSSVITQGLTRQPMVYKCQWCGHEAQTVVTYHVCKGTHLAAGVCCLTGLCCCCVPYCGDCCKSAHHSCASCTRLIGMTTFITE